MFGSSVCADIADTTVSTFSVTRGYSRPPAGLEFYKVHSLPPPHLVVHARVTFGLTAWRGECTQLARMTLATGGVAGGGGGGAMSMQAKLGDLSVRLHDDATQYKVREGERGGHLKARRISTPADPICTAVHCVS